MYEIFTKAGSFLSIILLGIILRQSGFFTEKDFNTISRIVLKITLPAAIINSFTGRTLDKSMLLLSLIAFTFGMIMILFGVLSKESSKDRSFLIINQSGCNIGNFALPFAESFLASEGVMAISLFDMGNSFICLGLAYSIALMVRDGKRGLDLKPMLKAMLKSFPLITYVFMTIISLFGLSLPGPCQSLAETIGRANAFMAMLMIGTGFHLNGDFKEIKTIFRIIITRYLTAIILSLLLFNVLPFSFSVRKALVIGLLSPISSAATAFTSEAKGNFGLSSAVNSISILVSMILITLAVILI